jgi:putative ABC transport system permease protein
VKALDRKLLREVRSSGGLLVAIASIIAIGTSAYVALGSAYNNLSSAQREYYAECRMADFSLELKKVPLADLEPLGRLPGVVEIRPRIQFFASVDLEQVTEPLNGVVLSLPDRRKPVIDDIVLKQGGYFTDVRENEVIVNDTFARVHGLHPGQWIHLLLNNRRQELFIVGTAISSEFVYLLGPGAMVPDPKHFGVFYLKQTFAEEVFDFEGAANQVLGRLAPNVRDRPQEVLRQAELLLSSYGVFTTTPLHDQPSHRFISNEIMGLRAFGIINPAIFLAVAVMVLNVLISRLTEQQRVVIGTLKALGYLDRQVFAHFMKFGLCVGFVGGVAGCVMAWGLAYGMTSMYRGFFEFPSLHNEFYPLTNLAGMLISLFCGVAGSVHGARGVLKLDPAEAMRPKPPVQGGAIWLEHIVWLWKQLSFGWRMTLRSIFRNRLRTAAGVFAAAMGSAVAVNAMMLAWETTYLVDFQFYHVQHSDIDLTFEDERGIEALAEVQHLPGVDHVEPVFNVACTFINGSHTRKGSITGLVQNSRLTVPRNGRGDRVRIPTAGLTVSRKMADLLQVQRGDIITILPTKGLREARQVRIVDIADSYLGIAVYADIHFLSRLVNEELAMTGAQLTVQPDASLTRAMYGELKQMPALQAVSSRHDTIRNVMDTLIKNQRVFIGLLVMFAGVIFFGSVLNSSLVSLAERTREVATLRVLGYTEWQVGGLFLRESMISNFLGTVAGLPMGYLLNVGITKAYDTEMFRIPVIDPRGVFWATIVLGMVFGLLAHAFVQRAIFKLDWLEAMKTRE